jgi:hypothetical protein
MVTNSNTLNCVSEVLRRINFDNVLDEIVLFLRNNLTDRRNRTIIATESLTITSSNVYTLTGDLDTAGRHKIMNMLWVKVDGVLQPVHTTYDVGYRKDSPILGKINFWNTPVGTTITCSYGHTYSWIYPENPRIDLTTKSYPRVSVQIKGTPTEGGLGGKSTLYDITITLTIIDETRNQVENIARQIQQLFAEESTKKGFWNFRYIYLSEMSDVMPSSEDQNDVVYGQQLELKIPFEYEYSK